jgi:hypothetical protein
MEKKESFKWINPPPFAKISSKERSPACQPVPALALSEWSKVHSADDVKAWHQKWTPWFSAETIEGLIKYAYPAQLNSKTI